MSSNTSTMISNELQRKVRNIMNTIPKRTVFLRKKDNKKYIYCGKFVSGPVWLIQYEPFIESKRHVVSFDPPEIQFVTYLLRGEIVNTGEIAPRL